MSLTHPKIVLLGCLSLGLPVFAVVERRVERRFPVQEVAQLNIDTFFGAVRVRENPNATEIKVVVTQTSDVQTEEEMDRRLGDVVIRMEQESGGKVRLETQFKGGVTWSWKAWPAVILFYDIEVPKRCDLEVKAGEGSVDVGSLSGQVALSSDTGEIFTSEITGSLSVRSRVGSIGITACNGPIEVTTAMGNITVGRANGPTKLTSRGGYIELQRANGDVVIRGNGSDAEVGFVSPITHSADISTSGGSLLLKVQTDSSCVLDLRASMFGKISLRGDLPLIVTSGGVGKTSLKGAVNSGGSRIQARASGGSVSLRGIEPLVWGERETTVDVGEKVAGDS